MMFWRSVACIALLVAALESASWVAIGHPAIARHPDLDLLGRWLSGGMSLLFSLACLRVAIMGTDGTRRPRSTDGGA